MIRCGGLDVDYIRAMLPATVDFPCTYLDLPLSTSRLPNAQFQPYIDKLANRLPMWKGSILDLVGRAILVNVVLTPMTIYCMMALDLHVWMINALKGLCRGFLWCAKPSAKGGTCPMAWALVCTSNDKPWTCDRLPYSHNARAIFHSSVLHVLGNGESCLFLAR
jgi:hypothetical protein